MGKKTLIKRSLGGWRPVGAVSCPRCDKTKNSGGYQKIYDHVNYTIDRKLMCDSCRETFKEWYQQRSNKSGIVEY